MELQIPPMGVDERFPILKKSRCSTGVRELDIILEGGYINPGSVLLIGPSGMEKMLFAFHFAAAGVANGERVYYILTDSLPEDIERKASSFGFVFNDENFKFIDCYSQTLGNVSGRTKDVLVSSPSALNDLSLAVNDALRESAGKRARFIFHSLSTFALYNPEESLIKFLQVVQGRLKNSGATAFMLLEEGMHEKRLLAILQHTADEQYEIRGSGGSPLFFIPQLNIEVPFRLQPNGIVIV